VILPPRTASRGPWGLYLYILYIDYIDYRLKSNFKLNFVNIKAERESARTPGEKKFPGISGPIKKQFPYIRKNFPGVEEDSRLFFLFIPLPV